MQTVKLAHSFSYHYYNHFVSSFFSLLIQSFFSLLIQQLIIQACRCQLIFLNFLKFSLYSSCCWIIWSPTPFWNSVTAIFCLPYKWSLSITLPWTSLTASCIYSKGDWKFKFFESTAKAASFPAEENFILIVKTHTCSEDHARSLKWI